MKNLTIPEMQTLDKLARQIRQGALNVRKARINFENAAAALIAEALDNGSKLTEARGILGPAHCKDWISEKLATIPVEDATAWMHCADHADQPIARSLKTLGAI